MWVSLDLSSWKKQCVCRNCCMLMIHFPTTCVSVQEKEGRGLDLSQGLVVTLLVPSDRQQTGPSESQWHFGALPPSLELPPPSLFGSVCQRASSKPIISVWSWLCSVMASCPLAPPPHSFPEVNAPGWMCAQVKKNHIWETHTKKTSLPTATTLTIVDDLKSSTGWSDMVVLPDPCLCCLYLFTGGEDPSPHRLLTGGFCRVGEWRWMWHVVLTPFMTKSPKSKPVVSSSCWAFTQWLLITVNWPLLTANLIHEQVQPKEADSSRSIALSRSIVIIMQIQRKLILCLWRWWFFYFMRLCVSRNVSAVQFSQKSKVVFTFLDTSAVNVKLFMSLF